VRNFQLSGVPMMRAQATWSLYSAIAPEFEGLHPPSGILFQKYMHLPFQAGLRSKAEIERFWAEKACRILHADPLGVAKNFSKRLLIFLNAREWSQEFDTYAYRSYSWFLSLPWTGFWLIGPLGFVGLIFARPATKNQSLVFIYTFVAAASIFPFKVSDRYRLTFVTLLTLFAAFALWKLFCVLKARNRKLLYKMIPLLGMLCLLSWPDWPHLAERKTARHEFFIGMRHETEGRLNEALRFYEMSMEKYLWDPDSPYRMGRILSLYGRTNQAMAYLQEALRREPQFPEAMNEIATIHLEADNFEQAESLLRKSLKLYPNKKNTLRLMATVQRRRGHLAAELDYLKMAVYESKDPQTALLLAARLIESEKFEEALSWYDTVIHSAQVDKSIRAHAAMLAGITVARQYRDQKRASNYWQMIVDKFADASFWEPPAAYLSGLLPEAKFRAQSKKSQGLQMEAQYIIGLKRWLEGDLISAAKAFEHALAIDSGPKSSKFNIPQKWIREDLAGVRQNASIQQ
jgi:tetratricopeptide (TPR) repeat protein